MHTMFMATSFREIIDFDVGKHSRKARNANEYSLVLRHRLHFHPHYHSWTIVLLAVLCDSCQKQTHSVRVQ